MLSLALLSIITNGTSTVNDSSKMRVYIFYCILITVSEERLIFFRCCICTQYGYQNFWKQLVLHKFMLLSSRQTTVDLLVKMYAALLLSNHCVCVLYLKFTLYFFNEPPFHKSILLSSRQTTVYFSYNYSIIMMSCRQTTVLLL